MLKTDLPRVGFYTFAALLLAACTAPLPPPGYPSSPGLNARSYVERPDQAYDAVSNYNPYDLPALQGGYTPN
jgi:hypothetical protein